MYVGLDAARAGDREDGEAMGERGKVTAADEEGDGDETDDDEEEADC